MKTYTLNRAFVEMEVNCRDEVKSNMKPNLVQQSLAPSQGPSGMRDAYLHYINTILVTAALKFGHRQTKNQEKIKWARVMLQAIATGNTVLKTQELEDLKQRIQDLEARFNG
jgi:hypothetical protein